jgi:type I restriction-modification system DNA methylase subunit
MQGKQLRKLEAELWRAADQLRANSKLTASEYPMPVLGLIFLRNAYNHFQKVKIEMEKTFPSHPQRGKRALTKKDFGEQNSIFLPEKSQFDYLKALPDYPTYQTEDIDLKTNLVFEHLKHQYFRGGMSIYGQSISMCYLQANYQS